jgi:hypothetical protein
MEDEARQDKLTTHLIFNSIVDSKWEEFPLLTWNWQMMRDFCLVDDDCCCASFSWVGICSQATSACAQILAVPLPGQTGVSLPHSGACGNENHSFIPAFPIRLSLNRLESEIKTSVIITSRWISQKKRGNYVRVNIIVRYLFSTPSHNVNKMNWFMAYMYMLLSNKKFEVIVAFTQVLFTPINHGRTNHNKHHSIWGVRSSFIMQWSLLPTLF